MPTLNMKAVLRITGLSAPTLRAWERRYGAVTPERTDSGRRTYTEKETNRLRLLGELVQKGHSIGGIAKRSDKELMSLLSSVRTQEASSKADSALSLPHVESLLDAIAQFDYEKLRTALARARHLHSPRDFALHLVPEVMAQVGAQIENGSLNYAQEHALSDLVRHHLRKIYDDLEALEGSHKLNRTLLFATPEGQYHDFGVLLAAITCRFHGAFTHFLGPNLPAESLAQAARDLSANAVVLGIAITPAKGAAVNSPSSYLQTLHALLPKPVALWVGGSGALGLKRKGIARELWIFESLQALDEKLV